MRKLLIGGALFIFATTPCLAYVEDPARGADDEDDDDEIE